MFVACSTLCFGKYPLEDALRIINELEFSKFEVGVHEQGPHLKPSEIVADLTAVFQRLRGGPSLIPAAYSIESWTPDDKQFHNELRALCRLARLTTASVITIPAAKASTSLDAEATRLKHLVHLADAEGIILSLATRIGTLTENPDTAVSLCERVPGLGITLDPSHFLAGPHQGKHYENVYPYVRHVQLRDTGRGPGQFQVRVGQGEIEYGRIVAQLARYGYERLLTVSVHDIPDSPFAMEPEVRKLKYLLESLV
jgi:sugar phosphate isomerase/epimerase